MLSYFILFVILVFVFIQFRSDYYKGLYSSLFFLILMPPNSTIDISAALPSFTIHRLILIMWLIMWLQKRTLKKQLREIPFSGILIAIAATMAISTALSSYFMVSIKRYFYFLFESLLFFIMLQTSVKDIDTVKTVIKVVSASLLIVAFIGVIERYTDFNPSPYLGEKLKYDFEAVHSASPDDVVSTYLHRILFGVGMAIGMMYYFFRVNKDNSRFKNILYFSFFFFCGAGLYFSFSRGPWLAFAVGIVFLLTVAPRAMLKKGLVLLAIIALVFLIRPGTQQSILGLSQSTLDESSIKGASFRWRFIVWNMAFTKIIKGGSVLNTLFGYGGGSHVFLDFGLVRLSTGHVTQLKSWDSEFAIVLFERGFIGTALMIAFYLNIFAKGVPYCIRKKQDYQIMLLPLACIVIFMVMKTNVSIFAPQLVYLEFISISMVSTLLSGNLHLGESDTDLEKYKQNEKKPGT